MINRYRRAARHWAEVGLGTLVPLDAAIPELRPAPAAASLPEPASEALPHGLPHEEEAGEGAIGPNSAEREGFEPSVPLRAHMISNHAPSATRSSLRGRAQRSSTLSGPTP